ncbi:MAG: aspartate aminotransferase family protein [Eubacteriales bacterium]
MTLEHIKELNDKYFVNIYNGRYPLCFTDGEGVVLTDISGKKYIDFVAGIAVNSLGYNHPALVDAICKKAKSVMHCSNFYFIKEQSELAEKLCQLSFGDKVFFANSGAEANEGAIKMAKKYFSKQGIKKHKIITLENSFHGRTLAMVAATGQAKYQKPYKPLVNGITNVEKGNIEALKNAIDDETAAVMMELIQGEGGVLLMDEEYVKAVRELCDEKGILLIFDEVQTGIARTGKMFAYEHFGVAPDIMTLAKGLGGGFPIGAIVAKESVSAFESGDHGTTFGGNPMACACALAVLETIENDNLLEHVVKTGEVFENKLIEISKKYEFVLSPQGKGMLRGLKIADSVSIADIINSMQEKGYLLCPSGGNTLRIVPPLIMDKQNIANMLEALDEVLSQI